MTQILKKLNKIELTGFAPCPNELNTANSGAMFPGAYGSVSLPSSVLGHVRHAPMSATVNQRRQAPKKPATRHQTVLTQSVLARMSAADQKQTLGERLYPLIQQTHPDLAGKITGMILEIENAEILHLLEFHEALAAKIEEAVSVIDDHHSREQQRKQR
jgi:hypothetical protein